MMCYASLYRHFLRNSISYFPNTINSSWISKYEKVYTTKTKNSQQYIGTFYLKPTSHLSKEERLTHLH